MAALPPIVPTMVVCGPTASGKSAFALALAQALGGEIIGCDSVQVYRGFDVGSAKATAAERAAVPHHLIDVRHWSEAYDAAQYASDARAAAAAILARGRVPILVGGTGLYLRAFWGEAWDDDLPRSDELRADLARRPLADLVADLRARDPARAAQIHPNDRFRLTRALEIVALTGRPVAEAYGKAASARATSFVVHMTPPRPVLHARIAGRAAAMIAAGLADETRALLAEGCPPDAKPMQSIGYAQTVAHLRGELDASAWAEAITVATRQYARRQDTWFRKVASDLALADAALDPATRDACARAWAGLVAASRP